MNRVVSSAIVVAVLISVTGCSHRAVRPKVGDQANVVIRYRKALAKDTHGTYLPYTHSRRVTIRCASVKKDHARFEVFYPGRGGRGKPVYTVDVDYGTADFRRKTQVRDASGRAVRRGDNVAGVPVPFNDFPVFDGPWPGDGQRHLGTGEAYIREYPGNRRSRRVRIEYWLPGTKAGDVFAAGSYCENQHWGHDKWLWTMASRWGNPVGKYEYDAEVEREGNEGHR